MDGQYDIAVIGGGINGAGIARDAAMRGLKVILLEKNDFGSGTSSWSSRLIHGGLRYLEYGEIPLVFESLHERRRLRTLAAHLVDELKLTIPIYENSRRGKFIVRLGMLAYDLLSFGKRLPTHRMLDRRTLLNEEPGLAEQGLVGGAQYYDAQVTFAERLVLENIIAARDAGAVVKNYCPVIGVSIRDNAVRSVDYRDRETGREIEVRAKVVINAAGPWVDRVLATVNREMPGQMGGTKGSHIVVGRFDGAPSSAFYVEARQDGRPFFIIPWNGQYLIGTTDIRYSGDPGDVTASDDEIRYLLEETNAVFPTARLGLSDIHYAYAGVRPLPRREKGPESAITRKHIILKHRKEARGLFSIIGGKLTTYRNLAELAVNKAMRHPGIDGSRCRTRDCPLPGAVDLEAARKRILAFPGLPTACAARLISVYGSRGEAIAALAQGRPGFVDDDQTVLIAEIIHAIRFEQAVTLTDIVHRRLMTGLRADMGQGMVTAIAEIAAAESGWDKEERRAQLAALRAHEARLRAFAPAQ